MTKSLFCIFTIYNTVVIIHIHAEFYRGIWFSFAQEAHRLHVARYLLIDVRSCARLRKHILSKRKPVHSSDIAHSQLQTDAICSKIDIHIKVLTQNNHPRPKQPFQSGSTPRTTEDHHPRNTEGQPSIFQNNRSHRNIFHPRHIWLFKPIRFPLIHFSSSP